MSYECINPDFRDWIRLITDSSVEEVTALDFGDIGYAEICESRLHWNCCPACRHEFPKLPAYAEWAGREYAKSFTSDLCLCKNQFVAKKQALLESCGNDAYVRIIADLANAEDDVHQSLRRALMVTQNVFRGEAIEFNPDEQEILSHSREFVSSLDSEVQHFVISATLCFELLRPMWEKVGLHPRFDPRTPEQILAELDERLARAQAGIDIEEPVTDLTENLRRAISESGLEPKVLWHIIESAASASGFDRALPGVERLLHALRADFDNFADSMKAGQMEAIRLSERSSRKADNCEADVVAQIGQPLYSQLAEMTRQQLKAAEFLYHLNSQEPNYFDGPVITMAKAYENELKVRVAFPVLNKVMDSHPENYGSDKTPLIKAREINKELTAGNIGWHLRNHPDFRERVRAHGFDATAISIDEGAVTRCRNRAAHKPICERAIADDLRRLILRPDGILSRLHPSPTAKSNC
ncbi:MAG: hypothetical protein WB952_01290 [Terriglobales bacterium]